MDLSPIFMIIANQFGVWGMVSVILMVVVGWLAQKRETDQATQIAILKEYNKGYADVMSTFTQQQRERQSTLDRAVQQVEATAHGLELLSQNFTSMSAKLDALNSVAALTKASNEQLRDSVRDAVGTMQRSGGS